MEAVERGHAGGGCGRRGVPIGPLACDTTLFGPHSVVRDGVGPLREADVVTPVLMSLSAAGRQMVAFREVMDAFG